MMKKILFLINIFILQVGLFSQSSTIFIKTINTPTSTSFPFGINAESMTFDHSDSSFIVNVNSNTAVNRSAAILKIDTNGTVQWMNQILSPGGSTILSDGFFQNNKYKTLLKDNYLSSVLQNHLSSICLIDTNGNFSSISQRYGGDQTTNDGDAHLLSIKPLPNGEKIACGYINGINNFGNKKSNWFVKFNQSDSVVWSKYLENYNYFNTYNDCISNSLNQYYFIGQRDNFLSGTNNDIIVTKTDSLGNRLWEYEFNHNKGGANYEDYGINGLTMPDNGILVFGLTNPTTYYDSLNDIIGMRLDANGNVLWNKRYHGSNTEKILSHGLIQLHNGNILLSGSTKSSGFGLFDGLLMEIDPITGNLINANSYGTIGNDYFDKTISINNSLYTIGSSSPLNDGVYSILFMKSDLFGNLYGSCSKMPASITDSVYTLGKYSPNYIITSIITKSNPISYVFANHVNSTNPLCSGAIVITSTNDDSLPNLDQFHCYPNPTNGYMNIKSSSIINNIEVFNTNGQLIIRKSKISDINADFDFRQFSNGIYLIKIETVSGVYMKKIIKL